MRLSNWQYFCSDLKIQREYTATSIYGSFQMTYNLNDGTVNDFALKNFYDVTYCVLSMDRWTNQPEAVDS